MQRRPTAVCGRSREGAEVRSSRQQGDRLRVPRAASPHAVVSHEQRAELTGKLARFRSHIPMKLPDCRAAPPTGPEGPERLASPTGVWTVPARRRASNLFRFS